MKKRAPSKTPTPPKPRKPKMVRLSITLPDSLHRALKALAAELGTSMSAVVRCILALSILDSVKANPSLLQPGESLATLRDEWDEYIIPELADRHRKTAPKRRKNSKRG